MHMTTMARLQYEAKKARKSAKFALAHLGSRPSVIVYQMGKVGSQTVTETLRASAPHLRVFHVHSLTKEGLADAERRYRRSFPRDRRVAQHFIEGRYLRRRLGDPSNWPWKVITLSRDPVAHNISGFFQTLRYHPDLSVREWSPEYQQALTERFLSAYPHRRPLDWFDVELRRTLGVDVYSRPFPREQGHAAFSSDRADVLVIRLEDLSRCARDSLSSFLGIRDLELISTNVAAEKAYADLYSRFTKELVLPEEYVESMYVSKYARHFYSDDEIAGFRQTWLKDRGRSGTS